MTRYKDIYLKILKEACNEMRLDYFPQVEASELLYKVITLEDIYLPLTLETRSYDEPNHDLDIDELIRRIDEKIAALEAEEAPKSSDTALDTNFVDKVKELDQDIRKRESANLNAGLRVLINADPGSGKTTFCKRLVLALINNDRDFLNKYAEENQLQLQQDALPILISCKNIVDLPDEELKSSSFAQLMYKLCSQSLGANFAQISETEFLDLINSYTSDKILIIFDGWDEILDIEKEHAFCEKLNIYIDKNYEVNVIITIRNCYGAPELVHPYTVKYVISKLTDDDIRSFCKKWCEVILASNSQKEQNYKLIAEQIIGSQNQQIRLMMKNPLSLSLLLTVSKNDGRLPENKSELFKQLVDLYIFWSTNKTQGMLSAKTIRVLLAYIAANFTKNKRLECNAEELELIVRAAFVDIEWTFSEDIASLEPKNVIKELSHTSILTKTYSGKTFSFSESRNAKHRQMQEYLTAYAIAAQYADEEYNNMSPIEIFEDKYNISQWREIIMFVALMNNGRLRQEIVKQLISKAEENLEDDVVYTNFLFDLIVNGADIRVNDKHKIYDIIFSDAITDRQIESIHLMLSNENKSSTDFVEYIDECFSKSVLTGNSEYGYAKATIEALKALKENISPFNHAESLLFSDKIKDTVLGTQILLILAWCKYAKTNNVFSEHYRNYKMPSNVAKRIKSLLAESAHRADILKSLKNCILANFVSYGDVFDEGDIITCIQYLSKEESAYCEIILSLAPVNGACRENAQFNFPRQQKEKYLERLKNEIDEKKYDEVIFTFNLCSVIGCWPSEDQFYEMWSQMDAIYSKTNNAYVGQARYDQISIDYKLYFLDDGQYKVYVNDPALLSRDTFGFLDAGLENTQSSMNKLSYLLRRHEIIRVEKTFGDNTTIVTPESLLSKGVADEEPFSMINYALNISGTFRNVPGDFEKGLNFLKASTIFEDHTWDSVAEWWLNLAIEGEEIEGLIVIYWLIELELLKGLNIKIDRLAKLIKLFKKANEVFMGVNKKCIDTLEGILKKQWQASNMTFTMIDDEGREIKCDILFTFDSNETGKSYIAYTDNTLDENGNIQLFASVYEPNVTNGVLMPIETEKEWAVLEIILEEIQNELREGHS